MFQFRGEKLDFLPGASAPRAKRSTGLQLPLRTPTDPDLSDTFSLRRSRLFQLLSSCLRYSVFLFFTHYSRSGSIKTLQCCFYKREPDKMIKSHVRFLNHLTLLLFGPCFLPVVLPSPLRHLLVPSLATRLETRVAASYRLRLFAHPLGSASGYRRGCQGLCHSGMSGLSVSASRIILLV